MCVCAGVQPDRATRAGAAAGAHREADRQGGAMRTSLTHSLVYKALRPTNISSTWFLFILVKSILSYEVSSCRK